MFSPSHCCCCFKTEILLPLRMRSSHEDGKTLLDYFNFMFWTSPKDQPISSDFICKRCSKALQVSYHFINMVNNTKKCKRKDDQTNEIKGIDEALSSTSSFKEIKDEEVKNFALNGWFDNNQLNLEIKKEVVIRDNLHFQLADDNFKMFLADLNTDDAGSSLIAKNNNSEYKCNICNITYEDRISFVEHNKQKHKEIIPYKCKFCSFYTCYMESLLKHYKKQHDLLDVDLDLYQSKEVKEISDQCPDFEITYLCTLCNFKDCNQATTDEHLLNEHDVDDNDRELFVKENFSCPACHLSFMTLKAAKIHFNMRHISSFQRTTVCKKRMFCCEKCGKFFDLKSGLLTHRRTCEQLKSINCNFCNWEFSTILKYEQHLKDNHGVAINYQCETCDKTFNCSNYLAVHRKRHNERNYQCNLCTKNYINSAELKVHKQRIHEIKYAATYCDVCKKKFANLTLLKYHENKKHKPQLIQCDSCDFVANTSSALKTHQFKHTLRPYECHKCEEKFPFRNLLLNYLLGSCSQLKMVSFETKYLSPNIKICSFYFFSSLRQHLRNCHSTAINNNDMAEMFKKVYGYTSRYDAFSEQNNKFKIMENNDNGLENEMEEAGINLKDVMVDVLRDIA